MVWPAMRIGRCSWQCIRAGLIQHRRFASLPVGWQEFYSEPHARPYYWHKDSGKSQWHPPEATQAGAHHDAGELPLGWESVFSKEHGDSYFWHQPSGRTQWHRPTATPHAQEPAPAQIQVERSTPKEKVVVTGEDNRAEWESIFSEVHGRPYYWHRTTGKTQWLHPHENQGSKATSDAAPTPEAAAPRSSTPSVAPEDSPRQDLEQKPGGDWKVVWSEEHNRNYYWHVPSGRTSWEQPSELLNDPHVQRLTRLLEAWREILHGAEVGQEIQDAQQNQIVQELLQYHPDTDRKIGVGLRSFKVDMAPPPNDKHRCFWVIRVDGSEEDFSARKCSSAIRRKLRESRLSSP
ncbi:DCL [Symbiodinium natans]|uniref:DCL protein n=1 Tax=Symbiodinium natans TaxID=878477 RepID=A0A812HB49_9DINO|nr:DCL [Symbiodinium natans]